MKIAYTSDTHLDFWCREVNQENPKFYKQLDQFISNLKPEPADVLIVAGDIGHYNTQNIEFLKRLKEIYPKIIVVAGNHDLYLVSRNIQERYNFNSFTRLSEFKQMCEDNDIVFLNGNTIDVEGVTIGGCSMWYDLPTDGLITQWKEVMNDSNLIMEKENFRHPLAYGAMHKTVSFDTQKYYLEQLSLLEALPKCDVFVSHVSPNIIPDEFKGGYVGDHNNVFYETDNLSFLQDKEVKVAIFGHIHRHLEYTEGGIEFIASPVGYPGESNNIIRYKEVS